MAQDVLFISGSFASAFALGYSFGFQLLVFKKAAEVSTS